MRAHSSRITVSSVIECSFVRYIIRTTGNFQKSGSKGHHSDTLYVVKQNIRHNKSILFLVHL